MHEAGDAFLDRSERTVLVVLDDDARYLHVLLISSGGSMPWVLFERFDRERHLTVLNLDDFNTRLVAHTEEGMRIFDEAPIELADVHQSFESGFELHEDTEVDNPRHFALNSIADLILVDKRCFLFSLIAHTFREDEFTFLCVGSDDAHRKRFADELHELAEDLVFVALGNTRIMLTRELGCWKESLDALPREDEATLVRLFDDK